MCTRHVGGKHRGEMLVWSVFGFVEDGEDQKHMGVKNEPGKRNIPDIGEGGGQESFAGGILCQVLPSCDLIRSGGELSVNYEPR